MAWVTVASSNPIVSSSQARQCADESSSACSRRGVLSVVMLTKVQWMWIADCRFVFQVVSGLETRGQYLRDVLRGSSILPEGLRLPGFLVNEGGV